MWSGLTKKLKDLAEEIATPHFDDDEDEDGGSSHGQAVHPRHTLPWETQQASGVSPLPQTPSRNLSEEYPTHPPLSLHPSGNGPAASPPPLLPHDPPAATIFTAALSSGGVPVASLDRPSPQLQQHPAVLVAEESAISAAVAIGRPPTTLDKRNTSPQPSCVDSLTENAVLNSTGPVGATKRRDESMEAAPAAVIHRIAELEAEKGQLVSGIQAYESEVRVAHEKTVHFYKEQIEQLQLDADEKMKQQIASSRLQVEELEAALKEAAEEALRRDERETAMQAEVEALRQETAALRAAAAAASEASSSRADKESDAMELIRLQKTLTEAEEKIAQLSALVKILEEQQNSPLTEGKHALAGDTAVAEGHEDFSLRIRTGELMLEAARKNVDELKRDLKAERSKTAALSQQLHEATASATAMAAPLKSEVEILRAQLQQAQALQSEQQKQADANASVRLSKELEQQSKVLQEEYERRLEKVNIDAHHAQEALLEQHRQQEGAAQTLETDLRREIQRLQEQTAVLSKSLEVAEKKVLATSAELGASEGALAALRRAHAKEAKEEELKKAAAANTGSDVSLASLTQIKKELEGQVEEYEVERSQLRRTITDTLLRIGVELSTKDTGVQKNASEGGEKGNAVDHAAVISESKSVVHLLSILSQECLQQQSLIRRAERVQVEWEQTYEQARQVNETLNKQVAEASERVGGLREDLSVKDDLVRKLQQRVESGDRRFMELQEQMSAVAAERDGLREARESWSRDRQQADGAAVTQGAQLAALKDEVSALQATLVDREEEVATAQESLNNLQMVLNNFQENKRKDVESLTFEAELQMEEMKAQLDAMQQTAAQHDAEKAALREDFESRMRSKDSEVTSLHRKLAEVRRALELTTSSRQIGAAAESSIDKSIISELLVSFLHAHASQRKEADDILKVMSGLLGWGEELQERAGLLPGPRNPVVPRSDGGGRRGLFSWRPRHTAGAKGGKAETATAGSSADDAAPSPARSLASLWVEFLLKESESATRGHGGDAGATLSSAGLTTARPDAVAAGGGATDVPSRAPHPDGPSPLAPPDAAASPMR